MSREIVLKTQKNTLRIGMGATLNVTVTYPVLAEHPMLDSLCSTVASNCTEYARNILIPTLRKESTGRPHRYGYSVNISCIELAEYRILFLIFSTELKSANAIITSNAFSCAASAETGYLITDKCLFSNLVKLSDGVKKNRSIRKLLLSGKLPWLPSADAHILLADGQVIGELIPSTEKRVR